MSTPNDDALIYAAECIRQSEEGSYERALFRRSGQAIQALVAENEAQRKANESFSKRQEWWNDRMFKLEAENTAQRELLRQAVEAMENAVDHLAKPHSTEHEQVIAAINEHLKEQP